MKFSKSAPTVLIGSIAVVIAVVSLVSNVISHQMAASFEEGTFTTMGEIVQSKLRDAETQAIASAEMIAAIPAVQEAFAAGDRDKVLALTLPAFLIQQAKYGISQAQFHTPPAMSFLRVHNPSHPPEDLSHYRQIVVEVNQTNAIRKGIEVTTSGIGIFGTLPMTDTAGKHVGSFEMATEFGPLLDTIKKEYGFEVALFVDETILRETAIAMKVNLFTDENRFGRYIRFYSTHPDLLRSLVTSDTVSVAEDTHYLTQAGGKPYGVLLQPVYNYAQKQIGVLAIARDFSDTRSADRQAMVWQALLGIVSIILLGGVVLMSLRGLVLRPLATIGEGMEALATGDTSRDIGEVDACDEVRRIAENYEAIRQGLNGGEPS